MPWHVGKSAECPASKPYAVIKDSDGSVAGCHPTKEAATKQVAALYANEPGANQMSLTDTSVRAEWTTSYINDLPDSSFLYIAPGGSKDSDGKTTPRSLRYFPVKDSSGNVDLPHLRNALARIPQSSLPPSVKEQCTARAQRMLSSSSAASDTDGDELRYLPAGGADLALRDGSDGEMPTLAGHFAVFDQWTHIQSRFEGDFLERIAPGAFTKTFGENRKNMRVLFQHGKDPQIAEKVLGPIVELREEERGAYYEVPLYDTSYNRDLLPGLRDGQYGSSFRFRVLKEMFDRTPEASDANPDGIPERTIQEAKVMEFGPVTFPAYEGATAGLRSATDWWLEQTVLGVLSTFTTTNTTNTKRADALEPEPPVVRETTTEPESRATRPKDYLQPRKERRSWELP